MGNLETKMKYINFSMMFLIMCGSIFAQKYDLQISMVNEYENKKTHGDLYYNDQAGPDSTSGNFLSFNQNGLMILNQYDQNLIYIFSEINFSKPIIISYSGENRGAGIKAMDDGFLLFGGGYVDLIKNDGSKYFSVVLYKLFSGMLPAKTNILYYADILFFIDEDYTLHSVLEPSMDQKQNMANYRDPEETKKLFAADSGVDLHGLTMDEKGMLFMNGKSFYLQNQYYGSYSYNILDQQNVYISDGKQKTRISTVTSENEIGESTAIHPSGDIYFLKYNKIKNTHILYRIENTWDSAFRTEWYKNADTQIVK